MDQTSATCVTSATRGGGDLPLANLLERDPNQVRENGVGTKMLTLNDCADYIITKASADNSLSHLKLHKLAYYAQAWHLAFFDRRLFDGAFEAWVHGPVSRPLYQRFNTTKFMYSAITTADVLPWFNLEKLLETSTSELAHVDEVLEVYAGLTGSQLERMTHDEDPWIEARGGISPSAGCQNVIAETTMKSFYRSQLPK